MSEELIKYGYAPGNYMGRNEPYSLRLISFVSGSKAHVCETRVKHAKTLAYSTILCNGGMMGTNTDFEKLSTNELIDRMWDATLPAWLGTSLGACIIFGAIFWRFAMRPWVVVIDYGQGDVVWGQHGRDVELFYGPVPPPIPMDENIIPLCAIIFGVAIIWAANISRNAVVRELRNRRQTS